MDISKHELHPDVAKAAVELKMKLWKVEEEVLEIHLSTDLDLAVAREPGFVVECTRLTRFGLPREAAPRAERVSYVISRDMVEQVLTNPDLQEKQVFWNLRRAACQSQ